MAPVGKLGKRRRRQGRAAQPLKEGKEETGSSATDARIAENEASAPVLEIDASESQKESATSASHNEPKRKRQQSTRSGRSKRLKQNESDSVNASGGTVSSASIIQNSLASTDDGDADKPSSSPNHDDSDNPKKSAADSASMVINTANTLENHEDSQEESKTASKSVEDQPASAVASSLKEALEEPPVIQQPSTGNDKYLEEPEENAGASAAAESNKNAPERNGQTDVPNGVSGTDSNAAQLNKDAPETIEQVDAPNGGPESDSHSAQLNAETKEQADASNGVSERDSNAVQKSPKKDTKKSTATAAKTRPPKKTWHDRLLQLIEYKKEHGNCLVPTRYKANPQLGKWVHNQREQYKMFQQKTKAGYKKKCSMTEERLKQLEEVGFVWSTERSKKQEEDWQARFQQLKEYQEKHGTTMVPHGYSEDPSLYEWVHRQRVQNASILKSGKEPEKKIKERMELLKTIGFSFAKQDDVWKERLEELRQYKEKYGHCEVPTHFEENPVLGRWVISQRYEYRKRCKGKKSVITQGRIDLLNELGFNWAKGKPRDRVTWNSRYEELVNFKQQEGHLDVPADSNPQLFRWCREQRQRLRQVKKNGEDVTKRMGPDRVRALEAIGFVEN